MKILKYFILMLFMFLIATGCTKDEIKIINVTFYDFDDSIIGETFEESLDEIDMPNISRKGYTLKEWVKTEENEQNVSYKAEYVPNKYVLKFTTDGTIIPNLEVTYDENIKLPIAEKSHYDFLYWTYEGKELDHNFLYNYDKDIRIVAEYKHEDAFLVEYKDPDGTLYKKMYVLNLVQATCDNPVKEGHTFIKWIKTEDAGNITFTADFQANTYYVSLATNSANGTRKYTFIYGQTIESLHTPIKNDYTFMGWYYNNEKIIFPYAMNIPHEVILYAKWEKTNYSQVTYQEYKNHLNDIDDWIKKANQYQVDSKVSYTLSAIHESFGVINVSSDIKIEQKIDKINNYYEEKTIDGNNISYEIFKKKDNNIVKENIKNINGYYDIISEVYSSLENYKFDEIIFNEGFNENVSYRLIDTNQYLAYSTLGSLGNSVFDVGDLTGELKLAVESLDNMTLEIETNFDRSSNVFSLKANLISFTFLIDDIQYFLTISFTFDFHDYNQPISPLVIDPSKIIKK